MRILTQSLLGVIERLKCKALKFKAKGVYICTRLSLNIDNNKVVY